jgi:hypothetical protein
MEVYDLETDTWDTAKTDMPTARLELCVAAVTGKIYAIGGAKCDSSTFSERPKPSRHFRRSKLQ